jgi:tetratricopeptide (TPR) repeat protein
MDAGLFYQLLLGELQVRQGSPGAGFSILLDAARKTRDAALFQRAVDVALQSRSGDAALQAAQTWKKELPQAQEPNRYLLQILLALGRVEEAGQTLATSIDELPAEEQAAAIATIPRVFGRVNDKAQAARVVEKALAKPLQNSATAASAWTTIGRMRRDAGMGNAAVEAALKGHASKRTAQGPLILAMSLLDEAPDVLKPVLDAAMGADVNPDLQLGYARALIARNDHQDALRQLQQINARQPDFAAGWLLHGLLLLELGQLQKAEDALRRHVTLVTGPNSSEPKVGLAEALLALSQIAQRQGQFELASQWLQQMPADADPVKLASHRADLLAQQGRMDEARAALAQIPASTPEQARLKALAQSRWLKEHRMAQAAYDVVRQASEAAPNDHELVVELALLSEKIQRYDEMETLLRRQMKSRPQDAQAFNALGYSLADRNTRLDEARALIQRAVELAPKDPYIQDSLGWVMFRQGQHQQALEVLSLAFASRPDAEIAAHLGEVLWAMGQKQQALSVWREGLMLKADNETLLDTLKRFNAKP